MLADHSINRPDDTRLMSVFDLSVKSHILLSWRSSSSGASSWSFASLPDHYRTRATSQLEEAQCWDWRGSTNSGTVSDTTLQTARSTMATTTWATDITTRLSPPASIISAGRPSVSQNIIRKISKGQSSQRKLNAYSITMFSQVCLLSLSFCDGLAAEHAWPHQPQQHQQQQQHDVLPPAQAGAVQERVQSRWSSQDLVTIRSAQFWSGPWCPDLHSARLRPRGSASQHLPGKF